MQDRNGYFQIIDGIDSVSMKYFPPIGNGVHPDINDVTAFLDRVGIKDYDISRVNGLITGTEEAQEIISNEGCFKFDETMDIKVTPDKMYAVAVFYPNSKNGSRMDKEEIIRTIGYNKISFGIDEKVIEAFVKNPVYCRSIIVAKGEKPIEGRDAYITYCFETDRKAKPQLNGDGTVDFHNLNNISNVKVGDVLAKLTKEDPGTPGTDVFGNVAKPKRVNRAVLKYGNGINMSEDGLELISAVDGHAILEGDKVFVSDNYDVPADVDNSTGDIFFNGSVTIKGNVRTGFSVIADGNVEVFGVVEGAKISAGGNIVIHRGIQGMGKSDISAKGNIISKFIEGADLTVGGYVETDTILNSNISARGEIYVRGRNASLIGGNVRSLSLIEAAVIGSAMGTSTNVEVGVDPAVSDNIKRMHDTIAEKTAENEKMQQILAVMRKKKDMGILEEEKLPMLSQLTKSVILNTAEIKNISAELEEAEKQVKENENARIRATKTIYPGVKATISGDYILIHKDIIHSEIVRRRNEIRIVPL